MVSVNSLPKTLEAVLVYHVVNALPSCTVTSADVSVVPVVEVKWNSPLTMSRVLEKPFTAMLSSPGAGLVNVTELMNGTVGLITIVVVGAGVGVTLFIAESVSCAVMVMVPATVPVITVTFGVPPKPKEACVLPAGIVNWGVQVCEEPLTTGYRWKNTPFDR